MERPIYSYSSKVILKDIVLDSDKENTSSIDKEIFTIYFKSFRKSISYIVKLAKFNLYYIGDFFKHLIYFIVCSIVSIKYI